MRETDRDSASGVPVLVVRLSDGRTRRYSGAFYIGRDSECEVRVLDAQVSRRHAEVFIARGAEVSHSVIGPKTFVGQFTEVRNSIACGSTLVNWERDSCLKVPDAFLLCSRKAQRARPAPAESSVPVHAPLPAMVRIRDYVTHFLT